MTQTQKMYRLAWIVFVALLLVRATTLAAPADVGLVPAALLQADPEASTYALWLAFLAIATTVASSLFLHFPAGWSDWRKRATVAVISMLLSIGGAYYEHTLDAADWGRTWLIVFLAASGLYVVIVKPLNDAIKRGVPAA